MFQPPDHLAVVWAHESHVGDARATEMGALRGEQLCRERFGDSAAPIGFGTYAGTVAAASDWCGAMEVTAGPVPLRAAAQPDRRENEDDAPQPRASVFVHPGFSPCSRVARRAGLRARRSGAGPAGMEGSRGR
ncbi:MAG: erythromycin esterase family protein [Roseicyclus sp.]